MRKFKRIAFLLAVVTIVAACQPQPTPTLTPSPQPPTETPAPTNTFVPPTPIATLPRAGDSATSLDPSQRATVRFVAAVPDAAPVDVFVDDKLIASRLLFGRLSSAQILPPGDHLITVRAAGNPASVPMAELVVPLAAQSSSFVMLTGQDNIATIEVVEEDLSPVPAGRARVNFVLFAPTPDDRLAYGLGDWSGEYISRGDDSVLMDGPPEPLSVGRYSVRATHGDRTVSQELALQDHRSYTFIVLVGTDSSPVILRNVTPTRRESRIRIVHAGGGLPAYDVYLNDQLVAPELSFRSATDWQIVEPRTYDVRLFPVGANPASDPLLRRQYNLNADGVNDLIIYNGTSLALGRSGEPSPDVLLLREDLSPTQGGKARLTYLHLARLAENLLVVPASGILPEISSVQPEKLSQPMDLNPGTYSIVFITRARDGSETSIEVPQAFDVESGSSYLYIVTGFEKDTQPFLLSSRVGEGIVSVTPTPIPADVLKVRILNALTDSTAIDVYLGETPIFTGVEALTASVYAPIVTEERDLRVVRAGTDELIGGFELQYQRNSRYSLIAYGNATNGQVVSAEDRQLNISTATVRLIYALPGGEQISVFATRLRAQQMPGTATTEPARLMESINYPGVSATVDLGPGTYRLLVRNDSDRTVIAELPFVEVTAGVRYDVLLLPAEAGGTSAGTETGFVIVTSDE